MARNTFSFPDGESVTNCTFECTAENATLTYETGQTAEATLLEDGILQLHTERTEINPESYMYFERVEP